MTLHEKFDGKSGDFKRWKTKRLHLADTNLVSAIALIPSKDLQENQAALRQLCNNVRDHGYALYEWSEEPEELEQSVQRLHKHLSLTQHDCGVVSDSGGLSLLQDLSGSAREKFIPYTSPFPP